jgi:hypothetical protein
MINAKNLNEIILSGSNDIHAVNRKDVCCKSGSCFG